MQTELDGQADSQTNLMPVALPILHEPVSTLASSVGRVALQDRLRALAHGARDVRRDVPRRAPQDSTILWAGLCDEQGCSNRVLQGKQAQKKAAPGPSKYW